MRRRAALALVLPLALLPGCGDEPTEVKLQVVKREDWVKALEGMRGKVVVVDIWAEYWPPCKKEFPHLVEMHKKYAGKGVACVSLSVDAAEDRDAVLKFLQRQKATLANFLLDEPAKVWQEQFGIYGPPAVFVFDRDGKLAGRFDGNDAGKDSFYADVEKVVVKLLDRK